MKNFFDCKDEKITEKAFSQSLVISVVSILLCFVALFSMTYSWFVTEMTSSSNTLVAGSFDVIISISEVENGIATTNRVELNNDPTKAGRYVCELDPGTYEISLKLTDDSTVKGHCIVTIGDGAEQNTAAIIGKNTVNVDENATITDPFIFRITVTESTEIKLEPRWGIVVNPDIYPMPEASDSGTTP